MSAVRTLRAAERVLLLWLVGLAPLHAWCAAAALVWVTSRLPGAAAAELATVLARHPIALTLIGTVALHVAWSASRAATSAASRRVRALLTVLAVAALASPFAARAIRTRVVAGFPPLVRAIEQSIALARERGDGSGRCSESDPTSGCAFELVEAIAPAGRPFGGAGKSVVRVALRDPASGAIEHYECEADGLALCRAAQ